METAELRIPLVIGVGNPDRGDDAAGRAVAARVKALGRGNFRVIESDGEAASLLALFARSDTVILVDAAVSDGLPGSIARFDVHAAPLPADCFGVSTHGFGLAQAVELARALYLLPRRCEVFTIEAQACEIGAGLSTAVARAVDEVALRILAAAPESRHA